MKSIKLSTIAIITATTLSITSLIAADPDHYNLPIARAAVTRLKGELIPLRVVAPLLGTDTLELAKAVGSDYTAYLAYAIPLLTKAFQTEIASDNGNNKVILAVQAPLNANRRVNDFRTAVLAILGTIDNALIAAGGHGGAVALPPTSSLNDLRDAKRALITKINRIVLSGIDTIFGGNNDAAAGTQATYAHGVLTRGALKARFTALITATLR